MAEAPDTRTHERLLTLEARTEQLEQVLYHLCGLVHSLRQRLDLATAVTRGRA